MTIGAHLMSGAVKGSYEVFYWRDRDQEVDFVVQAGKKLTAIEVKSQYSRSALSGIKAFSSTFHPTKEANCRKQWNWNWKNFIKITGILDFVNSFLRKFSPAYLFFILSYSCQAFINLLIFIMYSSFGLDKFSFAACSLLKASSKFLFCSGRIAFFSFFHPFIFLPSLYKSTHFYNVFFIWIG